MADQPISAELRDAEEQVERRSDVFKKELGLTDLALTQILFIIGLSWVGIAGKLGPSHIIFWLLAITLFYLPSAAVVIYLNRLMPLEGGLYQWAKLAFNTFMGFMVAWNLWLFVILNCSGIGLQAATNLSYAIGLRGAWIAGSKWFILLLSASIISLLVIVTILGLGVGKWLHKAGGATMLVAFGLLVALPILNYATGKIDQYHPLAMEMPAVSLLSLNILGKLGFGALGGFEYVAIHAGECRDPVRTIGRSVMVAAPLIAVMFILGTSSVLALVAPENIDLIGPIPQVLRLGFGNLGFAAHIVPVAIVAFLGIRIAQSSVQFAGNTRLPMVAGWDRLLPEWFTRLHQKRKTPVNSIIFVGAVTFGIGMLGLIGVGEQEAFQLLWNASGIFYALPYMVMFAIPLVGLKGTAQRAPWWLKLASLSGLLMTLLYAGVGIVPLVQVESRLVFAAKIVTVIVVTNLIGAAIFVIAERRRRNDA